MMDFADFNSKFLPLIVGAVVVITALVGGGYYFYKQIQPGSQTQQGLPTQQPQVQQEVKDLVSEVGKLIDLPTGENPTVATITDVDKLKAQQPFFQRARNGDKVLIYSAAKKAILYNPKIKKIIEITSFNIGTEPAQLASPTPTPQSTP